MKKQIFALFSVLFLVVYSIPCSALKAETDESCEDAVLSIVSIINNRDWSGYLSYMTDPNRHGMELYFDSMEEDSPGINQVVKAQLHSLNQIEFSDLQQYIAYDVEDIYNIVGDENIYGYLVGLDCDVKFESKVYHQGLNYLLWILADDGDSFKLVQKSGADYHLVEKYIINNVQKNELSEEELNAFDALKLKAKGILVNNDGEYIDYYKTENTDKVIWSEKAKHTVVPDNIRIKWRAQEGGDDEIYKIPFRQYCKQVLCHEWLADWNDASLFSGALCVKTFSWYYCINTYDTDGSYDVNSKQQSWSPNHETYTSTNDAVNGLFRTAMFNPNGDLFIAKYGRGKPGEAGRKGQGLVSQYGSHFLAQSGYNSTDILRYYYNDSDLFSGEIQISSVTEY